MDPSGLMTGTLIETNLVLVILAILTVLSYLAIRPSRSRAAYVAVMYEISPLLDSITEVLRSFWTAAVAAAGARSLPPAVGALDETIDDVNDMIDAMPPMPNRNNDDWDKIKEATRKLRDKARQMERELNRLGRKARDQIKKNPRFKDTMRRLRNARDRLGERPWRGDNPHMGEGM